MDDLIHAIVELGGTYPDVVQALQQAKSKGALTGRFAIDAVPAGGRRYDRGSPSHDSHDQESDGPGRQNPRENGDDEQLSNTGVAMANPLPGLFESGQKTFDSPAGPSSPGTADGKQGRSKRPWLDTMK